jgi:Cof subfamily protein (haloacid dehalogenase superfamily)
MYRLAAFDLDGTLLTPERTISTRSTEALAKWRGHGFHVVLATARPFYRISKYLNMLHLANMDNYAIAFNGAIVMRADGAETVYSHAFSAPEVTNVITYGKLINCPIFVYVRDRIISNRDDPAYRSENPDVDFRVDDLDSIDWDSAPVYKIAYVGTPDVVKEMRSQLPPNLEQSYEVSSSLPQVVDFVPLGTSKASALARIGSILSIDPDEMVAFGDEDNDIPLLQFVGLGVAMRNASEAVKAIADTICESNANDGVADVIENLLSGKFVI